MRTVMAVVHCHWYRCSCMVHMN